MNWHARLGVLLIASIVAGGCNRGTQAGGGGGGAGGEATEPAGLPAGWPSVVVIGPGTDPALYLGSEADSAAFGYLNPGVRVRLEGAPRAGRVAALVAGPLPTKGWVPVDRIAAYAQRRGRVEGTPYYVGPNDFVNIVGPASEGNMRVAVRPWLGGATFLDPRVGTLPAAHLADRRVDAASAEAPSAGECYRLPAGETVPVYERPGGQPVESLPAQDPPLTVVVLRERAPWYGIRAGYGPFVVGYVQGQLTRCEGAPPEPAPMVAAGTGGMPSWMAHESGTLHRVASGTRVQFGGRTIARLRQDGWARELGREGDELVDVFVAVDDDVAIRGLVPASALTQP